MINKRKIPFWAAALLLCFLVPPALLLDAGAKGNKDALAYKAAYGLILKEEWKKASGAFADFVVTYPKSPYADDARFWQCYCKEKLGHDLESVFNCYSNFIRNDKCSKWADDARSNMIRIAHQLAGEGKEEYIKVVRAFKKDQDADIQLAALHALEDIGDKESLEAIVKMYDTSRDIKLKERIIHILEGLTSNRGFPLLLDKAKTEKEPALQFRIIKALEEFKDDAAVPVLVKFATGSAVKRVRKAAVKALGKIGSPRARQALIKIAGSK